MPFFSTKGYIDQDGDNIVEQEEVSFDLCYLHLTGKSTLLIAHGYDS